MPVVGSAFRELAGKLENPYTVIGKDITEQKRERLSDLLDIHPRPTEGQSDEAVSSTNIIGDPVEENRSTLSHVASVFLPDGKSNPESRGCPINFLDMPHPYVTTMPMYFPYGAEGLDDPDRMLDVNSEADFVLHYLRNVRKELSEFPLFTFLAVYRLETHRLLSCFNAFRGYVTSDSSTAQAVQDFRLRFMNLTGSDDYYTKQRLDIKAKSEIFGCPQIFYTFTNTNRWEVTLASCLLQDGHGVWHVKDEENWSVLPGMKAPEDEDNQYTVHTPSIGCTQCPFHKNCQRTFVRKYLARDQEERLLNRNPINCEQDIRSESQISGEECFEIRSDESESFP